MAASYCLYQILVYFRERLSAEQHVGGDFDTGLLGQDISSATYRELDPEVQLRRGMPQMSTETYRVLYIMLYCICPSILGVLDMVRTAPSVKTHLYTITNGRLPRGQPKMLSTSTTFIPDYVFLNMNKDKRTMNEW